MKEEDISAISVIEEQTDSPFSTAGLKKTLISGTARGLVVENSSVVHGCTEVIGWCLVQLVFPEAELHKISVKRDWRGIGVGQALLEYLLSYLSANHFQELFLEVRSQNQVALNLYCKYGFQEIARRQHYYKAPIDDALILQKKLP